MSKKLLEYLLEHFKICWKRHATAPIPSFNEEKINIFSFNHNTEEPLRDKSCEVYIQDDYIMIDWLCQEEWYSGLYGMEDELTRWAKYWVNQCKREISSDTEIETVQIKVKVADRDGFKRDSFILKI